MVYVHNNTILMLDKEMQEIVSNDQAKNVMVQTNIL